MPSITGFHAICIARECLEDEPFANTIDSTRIRVIYSQQYGPPEAPRTCWIVDFAKIEAEEAGAPGLWAEGYQVVIDPGTREVIEATRYER